MEGEIVKKGQLSTKLELFITSGWGMVLWYLDKFPLLQLSALLQW